MANNTIEGTVEAWESRLLGASDEFASVASHLDDASIDEELGLKMISIRLEQSLINDFKAIATINNMGYQTLMRQALKRFANHEKKLIAIEMENRRAEEVKKVASAKAGAESEICTCVESGAQTPKRKKAA